MNIELITIIIGFLGVIIAILQVSNNVRVENKEQYKELKADIKGFERKLDYTNQRIDKVYDLIADLYKTLTKRDAA
jgi:uncharacterized membrane-anchored protein YhcB (DUF1043 family)